MKSKDSFRNPYKILCGFWYIFLGNSSINFYSNSSENSFNDFPMMQQFVREISVDFSWDFSENTLKKSLGIHPEITPGISSRTPSEIPLPITPENFWILDLLSFLQNCSWNFSFFFILIFNKYFQNRFSYICGGKIKVSHFFFWSIFYFIFCKKHFIEILFKNLKMIKCIHFRLKEFSWHTLTILLPLFFFVETYNFFDNISKSSS